ncbi:hypothetical protein [Elioraea rosea]|uniref:hypothetical protein n=1 Tax=Elioraea rosea TaxID=2492390 RepID=UPI001182B770|nr:hypothetical protein [Elioraea rosea]
MVLFKQQPTVADALQLWTQAFGSSPDHFQKSPPGAPGPQATGTVDAHQFTLQSQPGRIELIVTAFDSAEPAPAIRDIPAALGLLKRYADPLCAGQAVLRIACVLQLLEKVASAHEAAKLVGSAAQLQQVPENAADLEFAINIRQTLKKHPGVQMNRLCRWAIAVQEIFQSRTDTPWLTRPVSTFHVAAFTVDINTVPRAEPYRQEDVISVFGELADEATRLMQEGYKGLFA